MSKKYRILEVDADNYIINSPPFRSTLDATNDFFLFISKIKRHLSKANLFVLGLLSASFSVKGFQTKVPFEDLYMNAVIEIFDYILSDKELKAIFDDHFDIEYKDKNDDENNDENLN